MGNCYSSVSRGCHRVCGIDEKNVVFSTRKPLRSLLLITINIFFACTEAIRALLLPSNCTSWWVWFAWPLGLWEAGKSSRRNRNFGIPTENWDKMMVDGNGGMDNHMAYAQAPLAWRKSTTFGNTFTCLSRSHPYRFAKKKKIDPGFVIRRPDNSG